jgi:hypothetical protein
MPFLSVIYSSKHPIIHHVMQSEIVGVIAVEGGPSLPFRRLERLLEPIDGLLRAHRVKADAAIRVWVLWLSDESPVQRTVCGCRLREVSRQLGGWLSVLVSTCDAVS